MSVLGKDLFDFQRSHTNTKVKKYHWIQAYQGIKTVFTIHNIEFQGQFDSGMLW